MSMYERYSRTTKQGSFAFLEEHILGTSPYCTRYLFREILHAIICDAKDLDLR